MWSWFGTLSRGNTDFGRGLEGESVDYDERLVVVVEVNGILYSFSGNPRICIASSVFPPERMNKKCKVARSQAGAV